MNKLTERLIGVIEDKCPGIYISDEGDYWFISVDNTEGEDFGFEINKGDNDIDDIISYCGDFDIEEHVKLWIGGPGAPGIVDLVDNTREIAEKLEELEHFLTYDIY